MDNPVDTDIFLGRAAALVDSTTPEGTPLEAAWRAVVAKLEPNQAGWVSTSQPISLHEGLAIVEVPDEFTRTQIEGRLRGQLEDALSEVYGGEIRLVVSVNPEAAPPRTSTRRLIDKTTCRQMSRWPRCCR